MAGKARRAYLHREGQDECGGYREGTSGPRRSGTPACRRATEFREDHPKFVPGFHFVTVGILAINLLWSLTV